MGNTSSTTMNTEDKKYIQSPQQHCPMKPFPYVLPRSSSKPIPIKQNNKQYD